MSALSPELPRRGKVEPRRKVKQEAEAAEDAVLVKELPVGGVCACVRVCVCVCVCAYVRAICVCNVCVEGNMGSVAVFE